MSTLRPTISAAKAGSWSIRPLRPARFDDDVPAVDITEFVKALPEFPQRGIGRGGRGGRASAEKPHTRHLARLLRLGRNAKHKEQGAKCQAEDFFPYSASNPKSKIENPKWHHLITRSALASTFGGMITPICLAALRLITKSNLVGCSTGRSAGFAPLRILST